MTWCIQRCAISIHYICKINYYNIIKHSRWARILFCMHFVDFKNCLRWINGNDPHCKPCCCEYTIAMLIVIYTYYVNLEHLPLYLSCSLSLLLSIYLRLYQGFSIFEKKKKWAQLAFFNWQLIMLFKIIKKTYWLQYGKMHCNHISLQFLAPLSFIFIFPHQTIYSYCPM